MWHPDEGTIHAWIEGELSADEARRLAEHVSTCPECAAKVAEARGLVAGASAIVAKLDFGVGHQHSGLHGTSRGLGTAIAARRMRWRPSSWMAIAATVVLAAGSVMTLRERAKDEGKASPAPATEVAHAEQAEKAAAPAAAKRQRAVAAVRDSDLPARSPAPAPAPAPTSAPRAAEQRIVSAVTTGAAVSGGAAAQPPEAKMRAASGRANLAATRAVMLQTSGQIEGCYSIDPPSTDSAATDGLPPRFALATDSAPVRRTVHQLGPDNAIGDVIAELTWVPRPSGFVITTSGQTRLFADVDLGQVTLNGHGRSDSVRLTRLTCR